MRKLETFAKQMFDLVIQIYLRISETMIGLLSQSVSEGRKIFLMKLRTRMENYVFCRTIHIAAVGDLI